MKKRTRLRIRHIQNRKRQRRKGMLGNSTYKKGQTVKKVSEFPTNFFYSVGDIQDRVHSNRMKGDTLDRRKGHAQVKLRDKSPPISRSGHRGETFRKFREPAKISQ